MEPSRPIYESKTLPSLMLAKKVGNSYTASLYGCLVSYVVTAASPSALSGTRAGCFSYGSGLVASFFTMTFSEDTGPKSPLNKMWCNLADVKTRLDSRIKVLQGI